jgi:hypothetical protein
MELSDIDIHDLKWIGQPIIGSALILYGGVIDSEGNPLLAGELYKLARHLPTGRVIIMRVSTDPVKN